MQNIAASSRAFFFPEGLRSLNIKPNNGRIVYVPHAKIVKPEISTFLWIPYRIPTNTGQIELTERKRRDSRSVHGVSGSAPHTFVDKQTSAWRPLYGNITHNLAHGQGKELCWMIYAQLDGCKCFKPEDYLVDAQRTQGTPFLLFQLSDDSTSNIRRIRGVWSQSPMSPTSTY